MGVKASFDGKKKMKDAILSKDHSYEDYAKMRIDIKASPRTIRDFVDGEAISKPMAIKIIKYLGFEREDIITDDEWYEIQPIGKIWEELYRLANFVPERLQVKLARLDEAAFAPREYLSRIELGSKVWIDIDVQSSGYLVLLEMDESEKIICLSPSPYIPNPDVEAGIQRTPQAQSEDRTYLIDVLGKVILIAAILPERPDFDWLSGDNFQVLDNGNLNQLLEYIKKSKKPIDLMRSSVKIV